MAWNVVWAYSGCLGLNYSRSIGPFTIYLVLLSQPKCEWLPHEDPLSAGLHTYQFALLDASIFFPFIAENRKPVFSDTDIPGEGFFSEVITYNRFGRVKKNSAALELFQHFENTALKNDADTDKETNPGPHLVST